MTEPLYDPDYPRVIGMDLERPENADPAEWEAFVSWYLQDGCEHMIQAMHDLWENRAGYGFRVDEWKDTIGGLPLGQHPTETAAQARIYWREAAKLIAEHKRQREALPLTIYGSDAEPELDALWVAVDEARQRYLTALRARFPHRVGDEFHFGRDAFTITHLEPQLTTRSEGMIHLQGVRPGDQHTAYYMHPIHHRPRMPFTAGKSDTKKED